MKSFLKKDRINLINNKLTYILKNSDYKKNKTNYKTSNIKNNIYKTFNIKFQNLILDDKLKNKRKEIYENN